MQIEACSHKAEHLNTMPGTHLAGMLLPVESLFFTGILLPFQTSEPPFINYCHCSIMLLWGKRALLKLLAAILTASLIIHNLVPALLDNGCCVLCMSISLSPCKLWREKNDYWRQCQAGTFAPQCNVMMLLYSPFSIIDQISIARHISTNYGI